MGAENDLIGLDQQTSRLVFFASETDFEEELDLSKSVLRLFPKLNIQSQLVDAHLYILERAVFEYVVSNRALSMLKGEALPHIVRKQFHRPSVKKAETEPDPSFPAANIKRGILPPFAPIIGQLNPVLNRIYRVLFSPILQPTNWT